MKKHTHRHYQQPKSYLELIAIILTAIGMLVAIIGSNVALIGWLRADIKAFEIEIRSWKDDIQKESKDFHGRLCAIEECVKKPLIDSKEK